MDKTTLASRAGTYRFNQVPSISRMHRTWYLISTHGNLFRYIRMIFHLSEKQLSCFKYIEDFLATSYAAGVWKELKKSHWFTAKVGFLGHTITPHKVYITGTHIQGLKGMKHPRTMKELRSFLGTWNLSRRLEPCYFRITVRWIHIWWTDSHLTESHRKNSKQTRLKC